jgi:hypothetical protein
MGEIKKVGISLKASALLFVVGLITIFFLENFIHPFVFKVAAALYFAGTTGLFLHLLMTKFKFKKDIVVLPISLTSTIVVMVLTFLCYNATTKTREQELESDGLPTTGFVKDINEITSRRGHKTLYVDIEYIVNEQSYTPTLDLDKSDAPYYNIGDTLDILYSKTDPRNFKIIQNRNKNARALRDKLIRLLREGTPK